MTQLAHAVPSLIQKEPLCTFWEAAVSLEQAHMRSANSGTRRLLGRPPQKYALMAYYLFWIKVMANWRRGTRNLLSSWKPEINLFLWNLHSLHLQVQGHLITKDRELELRSLGKQTFTTSLAYCSKPKLCFDSSWIGHPEPKFLCPVNSSQKSLSKKYEVWTSLVVVVVRLLSCVQLFVTPWTAACQSSQSSSISWSLVKLGW